MTHPSRRVLFDFPGLDRGRLFDTTARDFVTEPFIILRDRVRAIGYELMTSDDHSPEDAAQVWFWDVPRSTSNSWHSRATLRWRGAATRRQDVFQECLRAGLTNLILFIGEPAVVRPDNWDEQNHSPFKRVLTWSDNLANETRYFKFRYPIPSSYPRITPPPFGQRGLLAAIAGNKFSSHVDELYSARRQAIRYFEQTYPSQFALFGTGWDRPGRNQLPYSSYRGIVDHKWEVYSQYRFGLCYENMRNAAGYVTEKLFDCARAGCVPIYWGAPNITDYVDREVFIDRTAFRSDAELGRFLLDMSESEYLRHIEAANDYFRTERFTAFLAPAFAESVIRITQLGVQS